MSASRRKDKYILAIHKVEIYTVTKRNELDIHAGLKKSKLQI